MRDRQHLEGDDWERELTAALAALPEAPPPRGLRRKLLGIPARNKMRPGRLWWNWSLAFSLIAIVGATALYQQAAQQARDIDRGRRDLAIALIYFNNANQQAGAHIWSTFSSTLVVPTKDQTLQALHQQMEVTLEYSL